MTIEQLKETYANGLCYFAGKVVSQPEKPGLVDFIGNRATAVWVAEQIGKFKCDHVFEVHPPMYGFPMMPFRMGINGLIRRYLGTPTTPTF